ncbi:MAG: hypothetical protein FWG36_04575 [Oscillospiraceae bacterium]|nr:hypothetical protein [Oscillospiraceae bacterium]
MPARSRFIAIFTRRVKDAAPYGGTRTTKGRPYENGENPVGAVVRPPVCKKQEPVIQ